MSSRWAAGVLEGVREREAAICEIALREGYLSEEEVARCQELLDADPEGTLRFSQLLIRERLLDAAELTALMRLVAREQGDPEPESDASDPSGDEIIEGLAALDRLQVIREISRGGMGIVFEARQLELDRRVALKVIKSGPRASERQIGRFVREAKSAAQLNHPGIVRVFDVGQTGDLFYMTMEYIKGRPLAREIRKRRPTLRQVLDLFEALLAAVAYAHAEGFVHRDLKPSNVLVERRTGRPRLIDFGLAKDLGGESNLTRTGSVLGTTAYLSPEQCRGLSRDADARCDVFALGVILYELLAGRRPFEGDTSMVVVSSILNHDPEPLHVLVPDRADEALWLVVSRALSKKVSRRQADAGELLVDLQAWRAATSLEAVGESSTGASRASKSVLPSDGSTGASDSVSTGSARGPVSVGRANRPSTETMRQPQSGAIRRRRGARAAMQSKGPGPWPALVVAASLFVGFVLLVTFGRDPPSQPARRPEVAAQRPDPDLRSVPPVVSPDPSAAAVEEPGPEEVPAETPLEDAEPVEEVEPSVAPTDLSVTEPPAPESPVEPIPEERELPPPEPVEEVEPLLVRLVPAQDRRDWMRRFAAIGSAGEKEPTTAMAVAGLMLGDDDAWVRLLTLEGLVARSDDELREVGGRWLAEQLASVVGVSGRGALLELARQDARQLLRRLAGGKLTVRSSSTRSRQWLQALEKAAPDLPPGRAAEWQSGEDAPAGRELVNVELASDFIEAGERLSDVAARRLDAMLLFDSTNSMRDELDAFRRGVEDLCSLLNIVRGKRSGGTGLRIGFATYGNDVLAQFAPTDDLNALRAFVMRAPYETDAGNLTITEGVLNALVFGASPFSKARSQRRDRVVVVIGDAPPHDDEKDAAVLEVEVMKRADIVFHMVAVPPPESRVNRYNPVPSFQRIAKAGNGRCVQVESGAAIGVSVAALLVGEPVGDEAGAEPWARFVAAWRRLRQATAR